MSPGRRAFALAAVIAIGIAALACAPPPAEDRCPEVAASAPIVAAKAVAAKAIPAPPRRLDPEERALAESAVVALAPAAEVKPSAGIFAATLADPARRARLTLSLTGAPTAYRHALAYARLAAALGMHVVPAAVERHLGAGEIAALLEPQRAIAARIGGHLRVLNDGTVTALLAATAPSALGSAWDPATAARVESRESSEVRTWARWAASPDPAADERARSTRDFVEMLALDYLAANATRRSLLLDRAEGALVLDDNREAFPRAAERLAVDRLLQRLRPVARFPRGLRDALLAFDRVKARELLAPTGSFEAWLVSPRGLIELDERRAGLLSLVAARVAERGDAAVLSL